MRAAGVISMIKTITKAIVLFHYLSPITNFQLLRVSLRETSHWSDGSVKEKQERTRRTGRAHPVIALRNDQEERSRRAMKAKL
jgi:hypothetical protein